MEINYLDYLKSIEGKSVEEINVDEILKKDVNYDLELGVISTIINELKDVKRLFDTDMINDIVEMYMEKSIIFFNIIREYTTLKLNLDDDVVDNYNIILEEALKTNPLVCRCYKGIEEINAKQRLKIVESLSELLKDIPDVEDVEEMTKNFNELFSENNKESLKLLENITSFNDPSMKALKEVVYDASTDAIIKSENLDKKEDK